VNVRGRERLRKVAPIFQQSNGPLSIFSSPIEIILSSWLRFYTTAATENAAGNRFVTPGGCSLIADGARSGDEMNIFGVVAI
jgi:hypothetical protein